MKKYFLLALALAFVLSLDAPQAHAALSSGTVSKAVAVFFKEAPVMVEVARCESGLRQYDESGRVLRGGLGGGMIGLFQLHETYHRAEARARGYNIDTLIGNMAYARDLYRSDGTTPWYSSSSCWEQSTPVVAVAKSTSTSSTLAVANTRAQVSTSTVGLLTKTLSYGMTDTEVKRLQEVLNARGYRVTALGKETNYFGVATYRALAKFQCDQEVACKTRPETVRSIGLTDAPTRAVINRQRDTMS